MCAQVAQENSPINDDERLSIREKFCFGLGDLSVNITIAALSFYFLYFMVNAAGVKASLVSIIVLIAKIWEAFSNLLMGPISDKTNSKFGKRRVYILFGSIAFGATFILIWLTPVKGNNQAAKVAYYTIMYMLFNMVCAVIYVPYNSLIPNMTNNYDERTSINGYRIVLANIGIILGAALFALLADGKESIFYGVFHSLQTSYTVTGVIFGVVVFLVMLLCALNVQERYDNTEASTKSIWTTIKEFFKLKEFRNIMACYAISMVGFDILMAVFMFWINDALKFAGGTMAMIFVAIPLVAAIIGAAIWVVLSEKFEKSYVYMAAAIYMTVCLIFVIFAPEKTMWSTILLCIFAGVGLSAVQILPNSALPDVVDVDEFTYGERREGAYFGIVMFVYKFFSGIGVALVSLILSAFGYVESTDGSVIEQPASALMAVRVILGVVPGVFFLVSTVNAFLGRISRERFTEIKEELEKRHNAKNLEADINPEEDSNMAAAEL